MAQAVLINVFAVPDGRDEELLAGSAEGRRFTERQPGFVSTALHRTLDPEARSRYINVAAWESAGDFRAALGHPDFAAYRARVPFVHFPSVYTVMEPS